VSQVPSSSPIQRGYMRRTKIRKVSEKRTRQVVEERKLIGLLLIECKGRCMKCGEYPDFKDGYGGLHLHHKKPKGMGGTAHNYTINEVELLCRKCHSHRHHIIEA